MSDSYRSSDDFIRRKGTKYRSVDDTPAMREYYAAEAKRKEAARQRKLAAQSAPAVEERRAA